MEGKIKNQRIFISENPLISTFMAGVEGFEPSTNGFGDRYSTN